MITTNATANEKKNIKFQTSSVNNTQVGTHKRYVNVTHINITPVKISLKTPQMNTRT